MNRLDKHVVFEYFVRCVRGDPTPAPARFSRDTSVTSQPVVTDNVTGLMRPTPPLAQESPPSMALEEVR